MSLTSLEFVEEFRRIESAFDPGKRYYTKERVDMIFNAVKSLSKTDFERAVSNLIARLRSRPTVEEIIREARHHKSNGLRAVSDPKTREATCSKCLSIGFLQIAYHDEPSVTTLARCTCDRGTGHAELFIPKWCTELARAFSAQPVPTKWFPTITEGGPDLQPGTVLRAAKEWKARLTVAAEFWDAKRRDALADTEGA